MSTRILALWLTILLSPVVGAQDRHRVIPEPSDPGLLEAARRHLRGASLADLAWGGHLIARDRLHELGPGLGPALRLVSDDHRPVAELAAMALLDAAQAIDAAVPAAELAPFVHGEAHEVAILRLSRTPGAGPSLLELFAGWGKRRDLGWLAVGNLLAQRPCPGFTELVADQLELVLRVEVVDDRPGLAAMGGSISISCGGPELPEGFPPIATWIFHRTAAPGRVLVAPGFRSVWASRRIVRNDLDWPCRDGGISGHQAMESRAGWLRQLAGLHVAPQAHVHTVEVEWSSPAALTEEIRDHRQDLAHAWADVLAAAVERSGGNGSPPPAPQIVVDLVDRRADRSAPLPQPAR